MQQWIVGNTLCQNPYKCWLPVRGKLYPKWAEWGWECGHWDGAIGETRRKRRGLTWKSCSMASMTLFRGFRTHLCMAFSRTRSVEQHTNTHILQTRTQRRYSCFHKTLENHFTAENNASRLHNSAGTKLKQLL